MNGWPPDLARMMNVLWSVKIERQETQMIRSDKVRFVALMAATPADERAWESLCFLNALPPARTWSMEAALAASDARTARLEADLRARGYAL